MPNTSKFAMTQEFNRLAKVNVNARITVASKNLATKRQVENALDWGDKNGKNKKLQTFNLSDFVGKSYFDDVGSQNYLIQQVFKYFKIFSVTIDNIFVWKIKFCHKKVSEPLPLYIR